MAPVVWTTFGQNGGDVVFSNTGAFTLANQFSLSVSARVTGIWWFSPTGATVLPSGCGIFLVSTQALILANENPTWSGAAGSGWVKCSFDGSFVLLANTAYKVGIVGSGTNWYPQTANYWTSGPGANGITNGIVTMPNNASASPGQSSVNGAATLTYPNTSGAGSNWWVDVEVTTSLPSAQPPVAGFALESPRTWSSGDQVTTPRLRGDMYNLSALYTSARPMFFGSCLYNIVGTVITPVNRQNDNVNTWSVLLTQGASLGQAAPGTANFYSVPLPGWYLVSGSALQTPTGGGSNATYFSAGVIYTQGTASTGLRSDLSQVSSTNAGTFSTVAIGNSSAELLPMTPVSGDALSFYAYTSGPNPTSQVKTHWTVEWIGLPGSASINGISYNGPVGTVVANPKPATLWPPGPGATLSSAAVRGSQSNLAEGPDTRTLTWAVNPLAGQKVLIYLLTNTAETITSVIDNGTTPITFTQDATGSNVGAATVVSIYRADNITLPSAGSYTVTITASGAHQVVARGVAYSGVASGAPTATNTGTSAGSSSVATGNVTPARAGALYAAVFGDGFNTPEAIALTAGGWTSQFLDGTSSFHNGAAADKIDPGGPTATQCTWTASGAAAWEAVIAVYDAGITQGVNAIALSAPVPGLRAGQTIGLDWQNSQQAQPFAETLTTAAIQGQSVSFTSPLQYAHAAGAPVTVPVSAALLNEQIRDNNNFLFYPPMLRAVQGTASVQAIASGTWTTVNLALSGLGITNTIDNFSGWAATSANSYTIPVSGVYLIIGQIYMNGAIGSWQASLIDNNAVRYMGENYQVHQGGATAPAVRRQIRLTAGQTIALQIQQTSGSPANTQPLQVFTAGSENSFLPRLIVVFRSF